MHINKILIVEDEEIIRRLFQRILSKTEYQLVLVENVTDAFKMIQSEKFDLLITDLRLPDGHGLDVTEHDFPDHYAFTQQDLMFNDDSPVLMTEKDAVKCQGFSADDLWYVPVNAILSKTFRQQFLSKINAIAEKAASL